MATTDDISLGGLTMTSASGIAMGGFGISSLATPSSGTDAANKDYVDAVATGLDIKDSCRLATTAALPANTSSGSGVGKTLTATANGALSVDGVSVVSGDRILVKLEATASDNGIYTVTQTGDGSNPYILTRATDSDQDAEVTAGSFTFVTEGTVNGDTGWVITTNDPITVDTTGITWAQFSGGIGVTGGDGIDVTGTVLSVDLDTNPGLEFNSAKLRIDVANTDELSLDASGLNVEGVPNLFKINGVATSSTVNSSNLDELTDSTSTTELHNHNRTHDRGTTASVAVSNGDPVRSSGNNTVQAGDTDSDANARVLGVAKGASGIGVTVNVIGHGRAAGVLAGATAGDRYYMANGGGLSTSAPTGSSKRIIQMGFAISATDLWVDIQDLGETAA